MQECGLDFNRDAYPIIIFNLIKQKSAQNLISNTWCKGDPAKSDTAGRSRLYRFM